MSVSAILKRHHSIDPMDSVTWATATGLLLTMQSEFDVVRDLSLQKVSQWPPIKSCGFARSAMSLVRPWLPRPPLGLRFFAAAKPKINWQSENLYDRLGLKQTATPDEIKNAHRELVRAYHPDALKDPAEKDEGNKILAAVNSAYDILRDDDQRRQYDQKLSGRSPFTFQRPSSRGRPGQLFKEIVPLSFAESVFGARKTVTVPTTEPCGQCHGHGTHDGTTPPVCQYCNGTGYIAQGFFPLPCPGCGGAGFRITNPCRKCRGSGQQPKPSSITVAIPPGLPDEAMLNIAAPFGSVIVILKVADDPLLRRDGDDLHVTIPISIKTAVLGGTAKVPTLKGIVDKRVRPGTQPEDVEKIVGGGIGGRGSLFVHYKVLVPRSLSRKDTKVLQQFDDAYMKSADDLWGSNLRGFERRMGTTKK
jgi:molecular chaperone DnaJ